MRLARDAEMEFDDEGGRTQLELVERELKRRRRSDVVRLELEASSSPELVDLIAGQVAVTPADIRGAGTDRSPGLDGPRGAAGFSGAA